MLTVLGGLAELERELIQARAGEGRERAKARGVKIGRPRKPHQQHEAIRPPSMRRAFNSDRSRRFDLNSSHVAAIYQEASIAGSTDGRAKNCGASGEALSPGAVACALSGGKHGSVESQF
jgi:DNA invertase Pin-like site-specific DNA recombinase